MRTEYCYFALFKTVLGYHKNSYSTLIRKEKSLAESNKLKIETRQLSNKLESEEIREENVDVNY